MTLSTRILFPFQFTNMLQWISLLVAASAVVDAKLADRSRVVKQRQQNGHIARYHDNGRPLEGQSYRSKRRDAEEDKQQRFEADARLRSQRNNKIHNNSQGPNKAFAPWKLPDMGEQQDTSDDFERMLSSQMTGCCYTYSSYYANGMCTLYGHDCEEERENSHDSGDQDCSQDGLSFIGVSFSVNTANGNPYSYHLNDQFPMENIIDRDYEYVMSMDEDGWLVGGGYKAFDYSGKMP